MHPINKTFSVRDLQRDYRSVLDEAKRSHDAVLLINNSVPEAVVLNIATYNALVQDGYPADEAYTLKLVREAEQSIKKGKVTRLKHWEDLKK